MASSGARFELRGVRDVVRELMRLKFDVSRQIDAALYGEGESIIRDAKENYVPVDESPLKNSGHTEKPFRVGLTGSQVIVELGFGGQAARYALAVHEHPSEHSPPSWGDKPVAWAEGKSEKDRVPIPGYVTFHPVGHGPKYLEKPLVAAEAGMLGRIAAKLGEVIGR